MININVKDIRLEDAINAYALTLTLKHFNIPDGSFNVSLKDDKYFVCIGEDVYDFDTFDDVPFCIFCELGKSQEELYGLNQFYNTVMRVGFNTNDAVEYLNFYSESDNKKLELSRRA